MKQDYPIKHWLLTIFFSPLALMFYSLFSQPEHLSAEDLFQMFLLSFGLGFLFSLPSFFIYLAVFYFLSKKKIQPAISKLILISIAVTGVFISMYVISDMLFEDISLIYAAVAFICGLVVKIKSHTVEAMAE